MPVGVILVDSENRVHSWNKRAEEFIDTAGRPTLYAGMTLKETHTGPYAASMNALVSRIREGHCAPTKQMEIGDRRYRIHYRGLFDTQGTYLGIAQVIEVLEQDTAERDAQ